MTQSEEFARRLAGLEHDVIEMRNDLREQGVSLRETWADARSARTLAAGADRDVSEFRQALEGHRQALNALRETQREEFTRLTTSVDALREEMRTGFATVHTGMAQIAELLTQLTQRPDAEG